MSARSIAIAGLLGVTLGMGGGYWFKTKLDQAAETKALKQERRDTGAGIVASTLASTALQASISADGANNDKIQTAVAARVVKYLPKETRHDRNDTSIPTTEAPLAVPGCDCGGLVLDVGTVRLLNAAREGRAVDGAGGGAGQE